MSFSLIIEIIQINITTSTLTKFLIIKKVKVLDIFVETIYTIISKLFM